jgi:putative nucleotidyltransferase with HDIG domain
VIALVLFGQYLIRFHQPMLQKQPRVVWLLAGLMLIMLLAARLSSTESAIYLYPAGALALLYVAMAAPGVGLIGTLGLALLAGLMADNSLEFAMLVMADGAICVLSLRRPERLNSYIFAGLMVSVVNVGLLMVFNLGQPTLLDTEDVLLLLSYCLLNGVITAAVTLVGLYLLGQIFNLPTVLRLVELNQPGNALLQRLLREAPGTYQHSLQVANLCEQAANAVGANASLVAVAALYHDIGKLHAPLFFTENQRGIETSPHDTLDDPERSARIIIAHVTFGETLARQYRLPSRIVDFIREHHGSALVKVFYQQALIRAGEDETRITEQAFRYPGPKPQSRETGIMMLADSCEAALRSADVKSRADIELHVRRIIDHYRESGQLDECGLTLADLKTVEFIFVNMIEATTHPRINYDAVIARARQTQHLQPIKVERPMTESLPDEDLPWNMRLPEVVVSAEKDQDQPVISDVPVAINLPDDPDAEEATDDATDTRD